MLIQLPVAVSKEEALVSGDGGLRASTSLTLEAGGGGRRPTEAVWVLQVPKAGFWILKGDKQRRCVTYNL